MVAQKRALSIADYFEMEDAAIEKHEFHDGILVSMAGASPAHVRITTNLARHIGNQIEASGSACEPFNSDMRVLIPQCNAVFYPDISIVCGDAAFAETRLATLLNPTIVIEVISPSSERADRGIKFDCYRTIGSLTTYVLVSQDEPRIEVYSHRSDNAWQYDVAVGLESTIQLTPGLLKLVLKDVYARVEFAVDAITSIQPFS